MTLDIADAALDEGDGGSAEMSFIVSLSEAASSDVTVDYETTDGSASAGSDYTASNGTLTIAAGDLQATILIDVLGDVTVENDETFVLTLSNPSANAVLGIASATGRIDDDDMGAQPTTNGLNDTGVIRCSTETADDLPCNDPILGSDEFPRQDAEYGRDFTADDGSDGRAGFSFIKLDASGTPLSDQSANYAASPWECIEDAVTGLIWEVKSSVSDSPRSADATYSWRNSSGIDDGGDAGIVNGGVCPVSGDCDTEAFVAAANDAALCGSTRWRLPNRGELLSLVDFGAEARPLIDTGYFPHAVAGAHWSAEAEVQGDIRSVTFATGESRTHSRASGLAVRLVSTGDSQ